MIQRPRLNWFRMLFVWHGSVLGTMFPQLPAVLFLSSVTAWTKGHIFRRIVPLTIAPITLIGVALALFLGFRNSASYDRFWEGRKLWGALLNVTRSLTRQAMSLCHPEPGDPRLVEWVHLLVAFIYCLRHQLRHTDPGENLTSLLNVRQREGVLKASYRPAVVLVLLGEWLSERRTQGDCGEITAAAIDVHLGGLSNVLGGCERLASTPIPYPYSVMIHRTVHLYCFLLPFALVSTIGLMTPALSVFIAYTFMVLEALAQELEEPFGTEANDLPLDSICRMIRETLCEMAGIPVRQEPVSVTTFVVS